MKLRDRFTPGQPAFKWWSEFSCEDLLQAKVTVLCGPTGAGKTASAVLSMRWYCALAPPSAKAMGARFIPARDLCPPAESGKASRLREAYEATILILDDLGQEANVAGWEHDLRVDRVRLLLADRYDNKRTTIITTALSNKKFGELYDGGSERRLWTEPDVRVVPMLAPLVEVRTWRPGQ